LGSGNLLCCLNRLLNFLLRRIHFCLNRPHLWFNSSPHIGSSLPKRPESDKIHARRWAVHGLGYLEVRSAFPTLVRILKDQESAVRQEALAAMGELVEYKALPLFHARLVGDPSPAVRGEAAFRLGKLGSVEDIPALEQALGSESHPVVRRWVQWAIEAVTPTGGFD